jgi:hypothetical protein
LHYFLYFILFSSHLTRNIKKIALFSSFFIAFNKKHSKNCIISFIFFFFHRIQQETFKKLHYFLYVVNFSSHSTRNIQKMHYFLYFLLFFIAFNKKH